MGRILAIDYGTKRCGIAVTDPLQIIASPLQTVETKVIFTFLTEYITTEKVEKLVVGMPRRLNLEDSHSTQATILFVEKLKTTFPQLGVFTVDERFTSRIAKQTIIDSGKRKKERKDKSLIDKISASLILQSYLGI